MPGHGGCLSITHAPPLPCWTAPATGCRTSRSSCSAPCWGNGWTASVSIAPGRAADPRRDQARPHGSEIELKASSQGGLMERPRARGRRSGEAGFTLIELMVVVLIIAILIAIAIPTFLGARSRAQDRVAQSNLRNALTAEKTYYVDNQAYTADTSVLAGIEPPLTWTADAAVA